MGVKKENEVGPAAPILLLLGLGPGKWQCQTLLFYYLRLSFTILKDKVNLIKISQLFSSLGLVLPTPTKVFTETPGSLEYRQLP